MAIGRMPARSLVEVIPRLVESLFSPKNACASAVPHESTPNAANNDDAINNGKFTIACDHRRIRQ